MTGATFLSWHRSGLAALAEPAPTGDRGRVAMNVTLLADGAADAVATSTLDLMGAGDVAGLSAGLIAERAPPPGSVDAPPGTLCWLSLHDAGLPWALPTGDDAPGAPVPWLALLCLPEDVVTLDAAAQPLPRLRLGGEAKAFLAEPALLPLLAHAERQGGEAPTLARILAPTRLQAGVAYVATLVPARLAGVLVGLGQAAGDASGPAWEAGVAPDTLPVYAHWRFRCGTVPRFEDVVARLAPAPASGQRLPEAQMTPASLQLLGLPGNDTITVPLRAPFGTVAPPPEPPAAVARALIERIETAPGQDERLALPVYGRQQRQPGGANWPVAVATTPSLRLGSGLGARLARRHADALADFASGAVGEVDRANAMLARARAALAARRALHERIKHIANGRRSAELAMLLAPGRRRIRPSGVALSATLPDWASGLIDPALRRCLNGAQARAAGGIARGVAPGNAPELDAMFMATRDAAGRPRRAMGRALLTPLPAKVEQVDTVPDFGDTTNPLEMLELLGERLPGKTASELARARTEIDIAARERSRGASRAPPWPDPWDASSLVIEIDPARVVPRRVLSRLDLSVPNRPPNDLGPIRWEPPWPEPLIDLLARTDPSLVAPAAADLPRDGVVLLSLDAPFIEAMLAGANHQAVTDLIWRRFPVRMDMSPIRRLFPRADIAGLEAPPFDVPALRGWRSELGGNLVRRGGDVAAVPKTIVLMRTPLFQLFPDMLVYAAPTRMSNGAAVVDNNAREGPVVFGRMGADLIYLGFAREPAEMMGDPGWYLIFQGPEEAGGFALASAGGTPPSWADIGTGDGPQAHLSLTPGVSGMNPLVGTDAAGAAAMMLDRPLTVALHMSRLVSS